MFLIVFQTKKINIEGENIQYYGIHFVILWPTWKFAEGPWLRSTALNDIFPLSPLYQSIKVSLIHYFIREQINIFTNKIDFNI